MKIKFTIAGQPYSKSNRSKIIHLPDGKGGMRASLTKSGEAKAWTASALRQIPMAARVRLQTKVIFYARIFYTSERPDLDESLVLDVLQDQWKTVVHPDGTRQRQLVQAGVYMNDRQVRERHVWHEVDKENPRIELMIEPMDEAKELACKPAPTLVLSSGRPRKPPAKSKASKPRELARVAAPAVSPVFRMLDDMQAVAARSKGAR